MFAIFLVYLAMPGPLVRETDEGVGAHLFQIWLVLEIFMIPYFAITWLPRQPKQAFVIFAIQLLGVFVTCFPVFYFNL